MQNKNITFLIGSGSVNTEHFLSLYTRDYTLISADGGANHLRNVDIIPHKIIGDLDSLEDRNYWEQKTEVIHIAEQDSTDLEKVLNQTDAELYLAFGFAGNRFDHTLEILHVLSKYRNKNIIFFVGDDIIFRLPKKWTAKFPIGTRISLYPLHETTVLRSEGLKWPLNGIIMRQGHLIGTSNETVCEEVFIEQQDAQLVCVTDAVFYDRIVESLLKSE
jgi:thiamine pyrophosphokinase